MSGKPLRQVIFDHRAVWTLPPDWPELRVGDTVEADIGFGGIKRRWSLLRVEEVRHFPGQNEVRYVGMFVNDV